MRPEVNGSDAGTPVSLTRSHAPRSPRRMKSGARAELQLIVRATRRSRVALNFWRAVNPANEIDQSTLSEPRIVSAGVRFPDARHERVTGSLIAPVNVGLLDRSGGDQCASITKYVAESMFTNAVSRLV